MSRAWVILKRAGKLLKFLVICVIITLIVLLIWRVFSTGTPDGLEDLSPNAKLKSAYADALKKDKELYVFRQEYDTISGGSAEGYFVVPEAKFIPDANQVQIVFRYNNGTIKSLAKDYKLESVPEKEQELFDVSLVLYVGELPEDKNADILKDNENFEAIRIKPDKNVMREDTSLYSFFRYTFDLDSAEGASLNKLLKEKKLIAVHVQIYYNEDVDYTKTPYGAICVYDYRHINKTVELSDDEKEALES